jgi:hypothetical protein
MDTYPQLITFPQGTLTHLKSLKINKYHNDVIFSGCGVRPGPRHR